MPQSDLDLVRGTLDLLVHSAGQLFVTRASRVSGFCSSSGEFRLCQIAQRLQIDFCI